MPEIDFCTILGNLLSNAVEACQRQTQGTPSITINIGQAGESMIALSIQNTYSHLIRMKDGRFLSSKREDMGTGTTSVRLSGGTVSRHIKIRLQQRNFRGIPALTQP